MNCITSLSQSDDSNLILAPQVKIFLATLAREYSYTADVNTKYIPIPIPKPENQLPIVMKKLAAPL